MTHNTRWVTHAKNSHPISTRQRKEGVSTSGAVQHTNNSKQENFHVKKQRRNSKGKTRMRIYRNGQPKGAHKNQIAGISGKNQNRPKIELIGVVVGRRYVLATMTVRTGYLFAITLYIIWRIHSLRNCNTALFSINYTYKDRISLCTHFIYHWKNSQP